jgi:hypothetical protein
MMHKSSIAFGFIAFFCARISLVQGTIFPKEKDEKGGDFTIDRLPLPFLSSSEIANR